MNQEELADIIESCNMGWMLEGNRDDKLTSLLQKLQETYAVFAERFSDGDGITLDDRSLKNESDNYRVAAIVQALPSRSPEFIAGIWRIVHGDRIKSIEMKYIAIKSFELTVELESEGSRQSRGKTRELTSSKIEDYAFLRYLSIGVVNDKPFLAGYFPTRVIR